MALDIQEEDVSGYPVLAPSGRLDTNTSKGLDEKITDYADHGANALVLDFSGVDYVSSFGLRLVLMTAKKYQASKGQFVVCGLQPDVENVFRVSGFLKILTVADDRETALAQLSDGA